VTQLLIFEPVIGEAEIGRDEGVKIHESGDLLYVLTWRIRYHQA
jgi:hypothetical protein